MKISALLALSGVADAKSVKLQTLRGSSPSAAHAT